MLQKCSICEEKDCLSYFAGINKIFICSKCGVVYSENFPQQKDWHIEDKNKSTLVQKIFVRIHYFISNLITDHYLKYLKSKTNMQFHTALDIGAGFGTLVSVLNKIGINASGIESGQNYVKLSVTKKMKWAYFDKDYKDDNRYDLIIFSGMIFYLQDNQGALAKAKEMLNPNGLIFVVGLVAESPYAKNAFVKNIDYGLMILSKKNWINLADKLGLKLIDYTVFRSNLYLDFRKGKNRMAAFLKYLLKIKKPLIEDKDGQLCYILLSNN